MATTAIGPVAAAAVGGFASGYVTTGSLKGAAVGAVSAAATYGVGHGLFPGPEQLAARALAHGVRQGTVAEIQGGDFKEGFFSAGFSVLAGEGLYGESTGFSFERAVVQATGSDARVHGNAAACVVITEVYYLTNKTTGAIDKIGMTSQGQARYSQAFDDIENVRYEAQAGYPGYRWRDPALVDENIRLVHYRATHGKWPRLNTTSR